MTTPPPPSEPPTVHLSSTDGDWWERLDGRTPAGGRIPDWWTGERVALGDDQHPEAGSNDHQPEGNHPEVTPAAAQLPEDQDQDQDQDPARGRWLRPALDYYPDFTAHAEKVRPALSAKTRAALYNASAAGAGWCCGLVPKLGDLIAECGREASITAALLVGGGGCLLVMHLWDRRTRHWWPGIAWVARIPLASAVTALALYAPASQI
ncbi:hypothetical protein [Streptomyces sp. NPDC048516]|uniref:hypothetical protein n=1 Tax=Streptomyces sp. NPDC048516 TaxID=3365565 RepID=UPI00371E5075